MIDFELAIWFPADSPQGDRVCVGRPSGGTFPGASERPMPQEVLSGKRYDPFKLDVWQLGESFSDFKVPFIDPITLALLTQYMHYFIPDYDSGD